MRFVGLFAKIPWLYYLLILAVNVGVVVLALQMPQYYADKRPVSIRLLSVGIGILVGVLGLAMADLKGDKIVGLILAPIVCGLVAAFTFRLTYMIATQSIGVDRAVSMTIAKVLLFSELGVLDALIALSSAEHFGAGKVFRTVLTVALVIWTIGLAVTPFATAFARRYLRKYAFLTEPSVYVNGANGYSILFATSAPGTGCVTIEKNGVTTTYSETAIGTVLYDRQIHRVDVPKAALDGATYFVSSRETLDGSDKNWVMGKKIVGEKYAFRAYTGGGDLSFLCVSDNQGANAGTQRAVKEAYDANNYDFVLMLGDHAESYNDIENDIVEPLLKVSALASGSVLPVYYTLGNHEYRGMLAPYLWELIPTGAEDGAAYYTFTMGDAFFTVLNFANDHDDDFERYAGLADYNAYKDAEFDWYAAEMAQAPYEGYRYNLVISHIAMIAEDNLPAYEHECEDCHKVHDYKYREFAEVFKQSGVQYVVSGHSHVPPAEFKHPDFSFPNLHAGSHYDNKTKFRNSIVTLKDGKITYQIYGE